MVEGNQILGYTERSLAGDTYHMTDTFQHHGKDTQKPPFVQPLRGCTAGSAYRGVAFDLESGTAAAGLAVGRRG